MDNTKRFTDRVEKYVKYRPSYPQSMINYIFEKGISQESVVCDIGSGTGIFSQLIIDKVAELYAIEPNDSMRLYAENSLKEFCNYYSLASSAEKTTLSDSSVDAITVAQAFHWFDMDKCKVEFRRILKPEGQVFLIWNNRTNDTPFLQGYDKLLHKFGTDYSKVNHQNLTDDVIQTFFDTNYKKMSFNNFQDFNLESFLGRVFSSSYTPTEDHVNYNVFVNELKDLYEKFNQNDLVRFNYKTEIFSGIMQK